ncbi:MAG: F0F1 ATP synthase subunit A [Verrucomicrobia bacterium]|nr:F0F1 ATP synthase subunit A [Verrucomicrobiota bacterium]MCH8512001.1 F0F1 ATP synthase subunit A [Kiritimatiellia bacterium]
MSAEQNVDKMQQVVDHITHHVLDGHGWSIGPVHLDFAGANLPPWFKLSGLMGLFAAGLLCWLYCKVYDQKARVPRGITNLLESVVVFVRDDISVANLGKVDGRQYAWLFLTQFTLILTLNLMGLIPLFTTATASLGVTGAFAFTTFAAMLYLGIDRFGFLGFLKNFVPHGIPLPVLFLLVPIEIAGVFIKAIVLSIRLFANMLAGHIVLFAMTGLIVIYGAPALPAIFGGLFVYFLEILVAFLQAYIFTMLSAIFVGQVLHPEH